MKYVVLMWSVGEATVAVFTAVTDVNVESCNLYPAAKNNEHDKRL